MYQKIIRAMVEGRLFSTTVKFICSIPKIIKKVILKGCGKVDKLISIPAIYMMSKKIPVEKNTILFLTTRGEFDCNAKWICKELLNRQLPYTIYWTYRKGANMKEYPEQLHLVRRGSYQFYEAASKAQIIVDNSVSLSYLWYKVKENQCLIETWHGSIGIKRVTKENVEDKKWVKHAFDEGKMTNYCISNSTFEDDVYREDYWKSTPILKLGHARNDILFERDSDSLRELKDKIYIKYKIEPDTKVCLYAPTFRDDGDMRPYLIDYTALAEALQKRFGGEWVIFTRFHFKMIKQMEQYRLGDGVKNVSKWSDIQELLTVTDVGITDYSSWICDYILTRRPGFLFATDMNDYASLNRGFYYPLDTMPFPLATDNEQLIQNILNFDHEKFIVECEEFIKDKGCMDDGHASERAADVIEQLMKGEKI